MRTIKDSRFVTTLYREFCHRGIAGGANAAFLARLRITVTEGQNLDAIRIEMHDDITTHITLGYHGLRGVTVLGVASPLNAALLDINDREKTDDAVHAALSKLLVRFCRRHGILDRRGAITLQRFAKGA